MRLPFLPPLPRCRLLQHSQLGEDSWHSLLIALLRGLAALQVAAAHLRSEFLPGMRTLEHPALWYQALAFLTGFAHQAVVLFFLISGWLVGGSLLNKLAQPDALRHYAIDRVSRLWTVLLPTFVLTVALGILSGTLDPRSADFSPANPYSWTALAGNLVGLQSVSLPPFGANYPLWSLANESWYYLMFALLALCLAGARRALAGAALVLCAAVLPFAITLYFALWLLGAGFSRVRLECGAPTRVLLLLLLAGCSLYFRLYGSNDDLVPASFGQDLLLSLLFLPLLCSTVVKPRPGLPLMGLLRKGADLLSRFSFTLYVVHVPLLGMLRWLGQHLFNAPPRLRADSPLDLLVYLAMLAMVLSFAYGFYWLFEARTGQVRRVLKKLLLGRDQPGLRAM
jgi:peptidoglycan/LPS O-acetylase OafA/YrhL